MHGQYQMLLGAGVFETQEESIGLHMSMSLPIMMSHVPQVVVRADFEGNPVRQVGMAAELHISTQQGSTPRLTLPCWPMCLGNRWGGQHHLQGHSCRCTS
jgi:hypothetical protein